MAQSPEFSYATFINTLEAILQGDSELEGVDVSQELNQPTVEQCPAVRIEEQSVDREVKVIADSRYGGRPDHLRVYVNLVCWAFAGPMEGVTGARRLRDELVTKVINVVRRNPTMNNMIDYPFVRRVDFRTGSTESQGIHSAAAITLECWARA